MTGLPREYAARKALPLFDFYTRYFPLAQIELVKVAVAGNEQHNPGEPLHWARGKSMDQLNTAFRHMVDHALGETYDAGDAETGRGAIMHLAKAAWRLMAEIQLLCEARDAGTAHEKPAACLHPRYRRLRTNACMTGGKSAAQCGDCGTFLAENEP